MNKLERRAEIHLARLQKGWGVEGRYLHRDQELTLTGVPALSATATEGTDLVPLIDTDQDWIFDARELELDGQRFAPEPGDVFLVHWQGQQTAYVVANNIAIDRVFFFSEPSQTMIRVHTKPRTRATA